MKQKDILANLKERFGITELNEMQKDVLSASNQDGDIILLSPTGSGKTIAFLVPLLKALKEPNGNLQAVIIAPSRELVMQIGKVARDIATGHKVTTEQHATLTPSWQLLLISLSLRLKRSLK